MSKKTVIELEGDDKISVFCGEAQIEIAIVIGDHAERQMMISCDGTGDGSRSIIVNGTQKYVDPISGIDEMKLTSIEVIIPTLTLE
jgi:hypothetical protein